MYFLFFCWLFICKRYLGWGRQSQCVCYCLLVIMWFLMERFPLPLVAWDRLRYFIVALPEPSIQLFFEI